MVSARVAGRWPKAVAARDWLDGPEPAPEQLVWIDDHARRFADDVDWALEEFAGDRLVLSPGPHRGIDRADMRAVDEFLTK